MRARRGTAAGVAVGLAVGGCSPTFDLPAPVAPRPCATATHTLRAGFGRADITPPPGPGLQGNGPDAPRAVGHRQRLYVRALALEDAGGERVVVVVADLPQVSEILHRLTVDTARLPRGSCLGADRLLLAATHAHAGPGNFFLSEVVNQGGTAVSGYDSAMVTFLVERFARAIRHALAGLRPAVVAWDSTRVWGVTRNRSLAAHLSNRPNPVRVAAPPHVAHLPPRYLAVDPTLLMLRVDTIAPRSDGSRDTVPAGAFSVFAIHGTGNPIPNPLFDGDIHAHVERILERRMDALAGYAPEYVPRTAHLVANGPSGDVSPDWPEDRLCPVATIRPVRFPAGHRPPRPPARWEPGPLAAIAQCLTQSRRYVDAVGAELGDSAVALYGRLRRRLRGDVPVATAFHTVRLADDARLASCRDARVGTATLGGADDGRSRYYGWKVLGVFRAGFEESPAPVRGNPDDCHGRKRPAGGLFVQQLVGGGHPKIAQLMVVRVGDVLVGAVPWEVTTEAGHRLRQAMLVGAEGRARAAALVTLANGYLQYLTTAEEYDHQQYEGASNLYGPRTAEMAGAELGRLAAGVFAAADPVVAPIRAAPGRHVAVLPPGTATTAPARQVVTIRVRHDTVVVRFRDAEPGSFRPDLGPVIRFERQTTAGFALVAWDDDALVELRHRGGREWEARWTGCHRGTHYRVVLPPRELLGRGDKRIEMVRVEGPGFVCA